MTKFVTAFAPATVANVGPGFDVFGFALEGLGDRVTASRSSRPGVHLVSVEGDGGALPRGRDNIVVLVASQMLRAAKAGFGVDLSLYKGLPLSSGLGSSSASAVAAAVAVNGLLGGRFDDLQALSFAREGERLACGTAHADNVAASFFGGFTLVRGEPFEVIPLSVPKSWHVAVVHPHIALPTKKARAVIPKMISVADHTETLAGAAALIAGISRQNISEVGRAIMGDRLATPARIKLIPHYKEAAGAAIKAGAAGVSISGAGPSIFALTRGAKSAKIIAHAMAKVWRVRGIGSDKIVSRMGAASAYITHRR